MSFRAELLEFIDAEKTVYGVRRLCRVLGVSKSAYYEHRGRDGGARAAWAEHSRVYGARRLTAELRHRGHRWNRKKVARLMRVAGVEGAHRRRRGTYGRRSLTTATAPDLVERQFTASEPNKLWVADITYLRSWEGSCTSRW
jgi:putative transposase